MHEQKINEIKDAVRKIIQLLVDRGEPLTEELKVKLAEAMDHAKNRILQLRKEQQEELPPIEEVEEEQAQVANAVSPPQAPSGGNVPPLEQAPHESSNINAFRYEPKSGQLFVKFQGKYPSQNGPVYSYYGVPPNIYDIFRRGAVAPKTSGKNAWHTWKEGVTPSHGASMYALIKQGGYAYQRLS